MIKHSRNKKPRTRRHFQSCGTGDTYAKRVGIQMKITTELKELKIATELKIENLESKKAVMEKRMGMRWNTADFKGIKTFSDWWSSGFRQPL